MTMGYRSEVAYKIRMNQNVLANETDEEYKAKFKQFMMELKANPETERALRDYEDEEYLKYAVKMGINYDTCEISYHHEGLKWYPEYEGVKGHHAIMDHAISWNNDEWEERFDVAYARAGEETDDVEQEYWGPDPYGLLGLTVSIWTD